MPAVKDAAWWRDYRARQKGRSGGAHGVATPATPVVPRSDPTKAHLQCDAYDEALQRVIWELWAELEPGDEEDLFDE